MQILKNGMEIISEEKKVLKKEFRERTVGYLTAALGLVAGLAWNEAIKSLIEVLFPSEGAKSVMAKFIYAGAITAVIVLITVYLVRWVGKKSEG